MFLDDFDQPKYPNYQEDDDCPECDDGKLVNRYSRKFNGEEFIGCSNYPMCEFTFNK